MNQLFKVFSILSITFLIGIFYSCCKSRDTNVNVNDFNIEFSRTADSTTYSNLIIKINFLVTYASDNSGSIFITESRADGGPIRFKCNSKTIYDEIEKVTITNVLDSNKIMNDLLIPFGVTPGTTEIEASFMEDLKAGKKESFLTFKAPFPDNKKYQIAIEIKFKEGHTLSKTSRIVYLSQLALN